MPDGEEKRFQHRGHRGATEFTEKGRPPRLGTDGVVEVVVEMKLDVAEGGAGILEAA